MAKKRSGGKKAARLGRPPKAAVDARSEIVTLRLTALEYAQWVDAASADNRPLSQWIRVRVNECLDKGEQE